MHNKVFNKLSSFRAAYYPWLGFVVSNNNHSYHCRIARLLTVHSIENYLNYLQFQKRISELL